MLNELFRIADINYSDVLSLEMEIYILNSISLKSRKLVATGNWIVIHSKTNVELVMATTLFAKLSTAYIHVRWKRKVRRI